MIRKTRVSTNFGLHALVWQEQDLYVAKTVEIELASQGKSKQEALANLEEAISLYLEDEKYPAKNLPTLTNLSLESIPPACYA